MRFWMVFACSILSAVSVAPAHASFLIYNFQGTGTAANGDTMNMGGFFGFDPALITTDANGQAFMYSDPSNPSLMTYANLTAYGDTLAFDFTNQGYDQSVTINFVSGYLGSAFPTSPTTIDFGNVTSAVFSGAYFRSDQPTVSGTVTGLTIHYIGNETFAPEGQLVANLAVPEPSTWAMIMVGFASVGFALRRGQYRRRSTSRTFFQRSMGPIQRLQ